MITERYSIAERSGETDRNVTEKEKKVTDFTLDLMKIDVQGHAVLYICHDF